MEQTYSIMKAHGDRRIISTFEVKGKNEEECWEKAQEELNLFIENLELELESEKK